MTAEPIPVRTPLAERVYALIFNGISRASSTGPFEDFIRLSERERIAEAVFAELRAGNIEFRLGPLALLADATVAEARLAAETEASRNPAHTPFCDGTCRKHRFANCPAQPVAAETEDS
jgi:hypothetical protein